MKTVFSLFLLFYVTSVSACHLNQKIISLAGPVTMLLEELDLISDKNLLAISKYHPVLSSQIKMLPGGLFLGKKVLSEFPQKTTVIFDQSFELQKSLEHYFSGLLKELDTRGLDSLKAYKASVKVLNPFLKDCEERFKKIDILISELKKNKKKISDKTLLFFLGKLKKKGKKPELLMVSDGPVKWLKNAKIIKTYPSELPYVTWSQKVLSSIENPLEFGLVAANENRLKVEKLTPGIRQIYFLKDFIEYLSKNKIHLYK